MVLPKHVVLLTLRVAILSMCWHVNVLPSVSSAATDVAINPELENRFFAAMRQLEEHHKGTSGRAKFTLSRPRVKNPDLDPTKGKPEVVESISTFEISILGDSFVKGLEIEDDIEILKILNSEYAFVLTRLKDGRYSLLRIDPLSATDAIVDEEIKFAVAEARLRLLAAYSFFGHPIWEWVRDPRFQLTKLESFTDDMGSERVRAEFNYAFQSPQPGRPVTVFDSGIEQGYLIFAPQKGWKMVECSRGLHPGTAIEYSISCESDDDHPPDQLGFCKYLVAKYHDRNNNKFGEMDRLTQLESSYDSWFPWLPQYHCKEPLDAICHLAYDGDFKDHPEYTQRMLLTIRLRAIETRTWQLVCSHYAGTAVIDPRGRIVKQLPPGPGVLRTDQLELRAKGEV